MLILKKIAIIVIIAMVSLVAIVLAFAQTEIHNVFILIYVEHCSDGVIPKYTQNKLGWTSQDKMIRMYYLIFLLK